MIGSLECREPLGGFPADEGFQSHSDEGGFFLNPSDPCGFLEQLVIYV
jgi:hypothetical protein